MPVYACVCTTLCVCVCKTCTKGMCMHLGQICLTTHVFCVHCFLGRTSDSCSFCKYVCFACVSSCVYVSSACGWHPVVLHVCMCCSPPCFLLSLHARLFCVYFVSICSICSMSYAEGGAIRLDEVICWFVSNVDICLFGSVQDGVFVMWFWGLRGGMAYLIQF